MVSRFVSPTGRRPNFRPTLEVLEGRDCPTVSASVASGVLTVVGDAGSNQVSVVELGGGAVEVTGDGVRFPTFAGVESIGIETFAGNDRVEFGPGGSLVALGDPSVRLLSIDGGAGDDVMILRDPGPEPGRAPSTSLHFTVKLRGNTGSDFVRAEINHGSDVDLDFVAADGGDTCGFSVWQLPNGRFRGIPTAVHTTFDLGAGGNRVSLATGPAEEVEVNVTTSDRGGAAEPMLADRYSFSFDGAARMGPFFDFKPRRLNLTANLSGADDQLKINAREFGFVSTDIDTGAGNDQVIGKYLTMRPRPSDPPTEFAFNARLGDGDDRLNARAMGFDGAALTMVLGAGNDQGKIVLWVRDTTADPTLNVDAQLGAGDDSFRLSASGYHEARADLNAGPVGDGRDSIASSFVLPGQAGVGRSSVHLLDPFRLEVLGIGYPTAEILLEGQHCLVFFLGGVP
jgi:hypothetical protein